MDIKPTMSQFGFGHRGTRHIIIDHEGDLWLTMAPIAEGGFLAMGATSLPGTLRVEPLENGKFVPFTYTATEALLELKTKKGANVKFAVDKDAKALRITGNTQFRLNGVQSAMFVSTMASPEGVTISAGACRYFIAAKKGKISFDDTWILNEFHSVTPVVDVETEDGEFELYAFELPNDTEPLPITKTLDECAAENSAEFKAFIDTLVDIPAAYADVREKIAYPVWLCHRTLTTDNEVIVQNKYNSAHTSAMLMAIASMAFKDAEKATGMLLEYPVELPPLAGIAAARLIDDNMLNDSRSMIFKVYEALEALARWCVNERTVDPDELSFYAYRYEAATPKSPEFFKVGEPVLAPDLNTYLILVSDVLGRLAKMEYDDGMAKKWDANAKALTIKLIAELWDGENFIGKNAYTDEVSEPDTFLSLVPILLGSRLPQEIISKLAAKIDDAAVSGAVGLLLTGGLYDAGEKAAAAKLVSKALDGVRADGIKCPYYGASLLAMAHKVL